MKTTDIDPQKMTASTSPLRAKSSKPFFTNTTSPRQLFFTASHTHTAKIEHAGMETDTFWGDVSRKCTDCEKTIEPETQDKPKDMPYVTKYPALKASNHCEPKQADFNKIPGGTLACGWTGGKFGNSYFDKPNQKTGCVFNGKDHPGIGTASLPKGTSLDIKLDFVGVLVDACNADKILKTAAWSVAGKALVP